MKADKIKSFFLVTSSIMFLFAGCQSNQEPVAKTDLKSDSETMSKRFQNADTGDQTAVDSAIKLAQEHAALSEKMTAMQQENQKLISENTQLRDRISNLEPELKQTKKELDEANNLLVEMRVELNNWKIDVLGFRDEMRQADKAQLETLLKILEVLGGEVKSPSGRQSDVNGKPQSNILGETNE